MVMGAMPPIDVGENDENVVKIYAIRTKQYIINKYKLVFL